MKQISENQEVYISVDQIQKMSKQWRLAIILKSIHQHMLFTKSVTMQGAFPFYHVVISPFIKP